MKYKSPQKRRAATARRVLTLASLASLATAPVISACSEHGAPRAHDDRDVSPDAHETGLDARTRDIGDPRDASGDVPDASESAPFVVVTFNTGTGPDAPHDRGPDDGYSSAEADITDEWYGNGLAWKPFVEDTRSYLAELQPDIVAFQEIFWPGECDMIPQEARSGFVCEDWEPGSPHVAQMLLGEDYQVSCHPGKPDKCIAVRREFGTFDGCDDSLCLDSLRGFAVESCGRGARVAAGTIVRQGEAAIRVVNYHGTSGFTVDEQACRLAQVDQVFVDAGDGAPLLNGDDAIILGDFNTDPGRFADFDPSAARWWDFSAPSGDFRFISAVGDDAPPTYAGLSNIDHVLSDGFEGECVIPGVTEGVAPVHDAVFFDHHPIVCTLTTP